MFNKNINKVLFIINVLFIELFSMDKNFELYSTKSPIKVTDINELDSNSDLYKLLLINQQNPFTIPMELHKDPANLRLIYDKKNNKLCSYIQYINHKNQHCCEIVTVCSKKEYKKNKFGSYLIMNITKEAFEKKKDIDIIGVHDISNLFNKDGKSFYLTKLFYKYTGYKKLIPGSRSNMLFSILTFNKNTYFENKGFIKYKNLVESSVEKLLINPENPKILEVKYRKDLQIQPSSSILNRIFSKFF